MPLSTFLERFCLFFILQTLLCCFIEWMKWNETATIIIIILRWLQNIWWYISHLKVYLKWVRMCVGFKWMSVRANRFLFLEHHTLKHLPGYFPHSHSPNERLSGFIDGEIQNKINLALHLHRTMCSLAHRYWTLEANISYRTHCWLLSCCFSVLLHFFFALFYFVLFGSFKRRHMRIRIRIKLLQYFCFWMWKWMSLLLIQFLFCIWARKNENSVKNTHLQNMAENNRLV